MVLLQNFFSRFAVRLFSKKAGICRNYNFQFNFIFHNILIDNRVTFNNKVECCVDYVRESWQPVEASC